MSSPFPKISWWLGKSTESIGSAEKESKPNPFKGNCNNHSIAKVLIPETDLDIQAYSTFDPIRCKKVGILL